MDVIKGRHGTEGQGGELADLVHEVARRIAGFRGSVAFIFHQQNGLGFGRYQGRDLAGIAAARQAQ